MRRLAHLELRIRGGGHDFYVQIEKGQVDHTPALYVIDQQGREQKDYLTTIAYASVGQQAQVLAAEAATFLPGHPQLASQRSLAHIGGIAPTTKAVLPPVPGGTVTLSPGRAHLLVFFATLLTETSDLTAQLTALNIYARAERRGGLPQLIAVDEALISASGKVVWHHDGWLAVSAVTAAARKA